MADAGNTTTPPGVIDVEKRVRQFITLRDLIRDKEAAFETEIEPLKKMKEAVGALLLNYLNASKQENARTEAGTVHISNKLSATVEDPGTFRQFCIDGNWVLADLRANASRVEEWLDEHEGDKVPGVKFTKFRTVGVRRA